MITYTLVFAFDAAEQNVLLVKKRRGPAALVGNWNGLGGKVDTSEEPLDAAIREFGEECGLSLDPTGLSFFASFAGPDEEWQSIVNGCLASGRVPVYKVFCYRATADLSQARTTTDEEVRVWPLSALPQRMDQTARWLVQLARDSAVGQVVSVRMTR